MARRSLLRRGRQRLRLRSSCTDPRCSISRDPRCEDHTTCAAVAPGVVFTVRIYGTRPLYGPHLMRKFSSHELQANRSAPRDTGHGQIMAQLRCRLLG